MRAFGKKMEALPNEDQKIPIWARCVILFFAAFIFILSLIVCLISGHWFPMWVASPFALLLLYAGLSKRKNFVYRCVEALFEVIGYGLISFLRIFS